MKETIYTIPILDAFKMSSECPFCQIEKKLSEKYCHDLLNHATMDPITREEINALGFCKDHMLKLYHQDMHKLDLAVLMLSYMETQKNRLTEQYEGYMKANSSIVRRPRKQKNQGYLTDFVKQLALENNSCMICTRIDKALKNYVRDMREYWMEDEEFKNMLKSQKGFCVKHLQVILEALEEDNVSYEDPFLQEVMKFHFMNMKRVYRDLEWYISKMNYFKKEQPWYNSKDALIRSIKKEIGLEV